MVDDLLSFIFYSSLGLLKIIAVFAFLYYVVVVTLRKAMMNDKR